MLAIGRDSADIIHSSTNRAHVLNKIHLKCLVFFHQLLFIMFIDV